MKRATEATWYQASDINMASLNSRPPKRLQRNTSARDVIEKVLQMCFDEGKLYRN